MSRILDLNIYETHIGIWQDDANDPSFKREIYGGIIRMMRDRGWTIGVDPKIKQHYRILSPTRRLGRKGDLKCEIEVSGRFCKVEVWAETWPLDNPNGQRYDFNKRKRLWPSDRRRFDALTKQVINWLAERATIKDTKNSNANPEHPVVDRVTAWQALETRRGTTTSANLSHYMSERERTTRDGIALTDGMKVFVTDIKGRWRRGTAWFAGGNTWAVITGLYELRYSIHGQQLLASAPADLRQKENARLRRDQLERLLADAIENMQFRRAETLRKILFGDQQLYRIWSRKNDAFYAVQCCGYSSSLTRAGLYTREEAERETARVEHLRMVTVDGRSIAA
jgi:hypothetical protein